MMLAFAAGSVTGCARATGSRQDFAPSVKYIEDGYLLSSRDSDPADALRIRQCFIVNKPVMAWLLKRAAAARRHEARETR